MRNLTVISSLLLLAGGLQAGTIGAGLLPAVQVTLGDGSVFPVELTITPNQRIPGAIDFSGGLQTPDGDDILIGGTTKFDPFIIWAVGLVDAGAPTSFSVSFGMPMLGGPYTKATNSLNGVIQPGRQAVAATGVSLESGVGPDYGNITFIPGIGIFPAACDSNACGPFSAGPEFGTFSGNAMVTLFKMTGEGGGSQYGFTGEFNLSDPASVPEPGTWAMMAGGLGALVVLRRRRA